MRKALLALAVGIASLAGAASAATITQFNKTTNDGVYNLSAAQAAYLGDASATHIGFFRVREGNGTVLNAGDTFNVATMNNSVTSGAGSILAFLNGRNADLGYTGDFFDALGETTLGAATSFYEGVAFLFSGNGNIVFRGSSTFNAGQTRGALDLDVPAVPLPAAGWLLVAGLGGLGLMKRRRKA
ncbi:VPLPA-CTERM sorting domain-containing protein [Sulfitobacter sp. D35]|uniref:VPLPA-CTERM sorting domain-containing protein n=1 Tax=Sulfitobacter sp. D35 TaxID=3083252 RepID=UPI00296E4401|nr:VPLPA-CTERM sorting domain-containing protein [Sulfitobacter sp. D35]MDW4500376.1 VPLPA-CTERM sorting domain-containing protein [Sulfitobacter sp. D35]